MDVIGLCEVKRILDVIGLGIEKRISDVIGLGTEMRISDVIGLGTEMRILDVIGLALEASKSEMAEREVTALVLVVFQLEMDEHKVNVVTTLGWVRMKTRTTSRR